MTTLTNIDACIAKLESAITNTGGATYATVKVALLQMAVRAIRQQKADLDQIEALRPEMIALIAETMEVLSK